MLERNKVLVHVYIGTAYSLLLTDRAVLLSGMACLTAVIALGPKRCFSDLARSARATRHVHSCACGASEAVALRLPELFYGTLAAAARIE